MPASVPGVHGPVGRRVLVVVDHVEPLAADERRVEEEVDLLRMVEGLRVEVAVSWCCREYLLICINSLYKAI